MIQFQQIQGTLTQCRALLQQSVAMDMFEIKMCAAAAAPLGFGAATLAAAANATAQLQVAQGTATGALESAQGVITWLGRSADSSMKLNTARNDWDRIQHKARDIEHLMTSVQQRGRSNFWHGMTKDQWESFTAEHLSSHRTLTAQLHQVPGLVDRARQLTDRLMMEASSCVTQMQVQATTHAGRPPMPSPANLAMGTRTMGVAAAFAQGSARLQAMRVGPWLPASVASGAALTSLANAVRSTSTH